MKRLYEPLPFDGRSFIWIHRRRSESDYGGYYHWHSGCELLFVHQGQGKVIVDRNTYELRPGMLYFFQPYQLHNVYAEVGQSQPYERSILHFDPSALEPYMLAFPGLRDVLTRLRQGLAGEQAFDLSRRMDYLNEICDGLVHIEEVSSAGEWEEQGTLLLLQLLACIRKESNGSRQNKPPRPLRYSERIMQWLEHHYCEPLDLDKLSRELHMSKSYVSRVFRRETGSSITEYVTARRIKQACTLLQSAELTVERIGEEVGLPNVSYFVQLFKKVVGTSPHQYRMKL